MAMKPISEAGLHVEGGKMSAVATQPGPEWVLAEMPPGYQNRVAEIQRLAAELQDMGRFGRLLWQVGPQLNEAVRDVFVALKFDAELLPGSAGSGVAVKLEGNRRLLFHASAGTETIQKKGVELARVFQMLHEIAEDSDRVVLITNSDPGTKPADRAEAMTPEAVNFLIRMGASHLPATTLFTLWKLSLQNPDRAHAQVERLYAHAAVGTFELPASALL